MSEAGGRPQGGVAASAESRIGVEWSTPVGRWARDNPALAGTAVVLTFSALRLGRVSHGDPQTAYAILDRVGTANLLMAVLAQSFPVVLLAVVAGLMAWGLALERRVVPRVVGYVLLALVFTVTPLGVALIAVGLWAVDYALRRHAIWRGARRGRPPIHSDRMAVFVSLAIAYLAYPDTMWLPAERIELDGANSVIAYVLDDDGETVVVLNDEDRSIRYASARDIERRDVCEEQDDESVLARTPLDWLTTSDQRPDYPSCR